MDLLKSQRDSKIADNILIDQLNVTAHSLDDRPHDLKVTISGHDINFLGYWILNCLLYVCNCRSSILIAYLGINCVDGVFLSGSTVQLISHGLQNVSL